MDGILDRLFPASPVMGLLGDENMLQQARQQGLLGLAAGLLQAGGPSRTRTNIGQAIGSGLLSGQQMYQQAVNQQIQQAGAIQKLQEAQRQRQQQQLVSQLLPQVMTTQRQQALTTGAQAADPLAALIRSAEAGTLDQPTVNQAALSALSGALGGDPDKLKKVFEAIQIRTGLGQPKQEEYSTTPQTMMIDGRPTSVVFSKSGGMKVLSAQPLPSEEKVDTGSEILFRDKTTGRVTSKINKNLTPGESALLAQRQAEFSGYDIVQTPEGFTYVPRAPGGFAQPVVGAKGERVMPAASVKPPTEGQAKAASFLGMMQGASNIFNQPLTDPQGKPLVDKQGQPITAEIAYSAPNAVQALVGATPWLGQTFERLSSSENRQRVLNAQQAWVRAKLRKESGAVIGADEMADEIKTFFPQIGDSVSTIRQKALLRQQAEQGFAIEAGPAAQGIQPISTQKMTTGQRRQPDLIRLRVNPQTGKVEEAQ